MPSGYSALYCRQHCSTRSSLFTEFSPPATMLTNSAISWWAAACINFCLKKQNTQKSAAHRQLETFAAWTGPRDVAPGSSGRCRCSRQQVGLCFPHSLTVSRFSKSPAPVEPPREPTASGSPELQHNKNIGITNQILFKSERSRLRICLFYINCNSCSTTAWKSFTHLHRGTYHSPPP